MTIRENKWEKLDVFLFLLEHCFLYSIKREPNFWRKFIPPKGFNFNAKKIFLHMRGTTQGGRTDGRKEIGRADIWSEDTWPNGHIAERHLTERTFRRKNKWPKNIEKRTFGRNSIWPKIHRNEKKIISVLHRMTLDCRIEYRMTQIQK